MIPIEECLKLRRMGGMMQEMAEVARSQGEFMESLGDKLVTEQTEENEENEEEKTKGREGMPREMKLKMIADLKGSKPTDPYSRNLSDTSEVQRVRDKPTWPGSYFERSLMTY